MILSIVAVNRDKAIWGEDADDFRQVLFDHGVSFAGHSFTIPVDQNGGSPSRKLPARFQVSGAICSLSQVAPMLVLVSGSLSLSKHIDEQAIR